MLKKGLENLTFCIETLSSFVCIAFFLKIALSGCQRVKFETLPPRGLCYPTKLQPLMGLYDLTWSRPSRQILTLRVAQFYTG